MDLHDLTAGYALDALDAADRARYEEHLAACEPCREELEGFWEVSGALARAAGGPPPPASLRARILEQARDERPNVVPFRRRFAVPVLSGHVGGANALALRIAGAIGAQAVLTTASDVQGTIAVDLLGAELGWRFEDPRQNATRAAAAVVNGDPVAIVLGEGAPDAWPEEWPLPARASVCGTLDHPAVGGAEAVLLVTDRLLPSDAPGLSRAVLYRPSSLVLGIGCDRGAPPELVARGVETILAGHGLSVAAAREIASVDLKADEPALLELAQRLGCPLRTFTAAELDATPGIENPSARVSRLVGTRGVAEPAALLAAKAARLLVAKQVYTEPGAGRSMTLAVARAAGSRSV